MGSVRLRYIEKSTVQVQYGAVRYCTGIVQVQYGAVQGKSAGR